MSCGTLRLSSGPRGARSVPEHPPGGEPGAAVPPPARARARSGLAAIPCRGSGPDPGPPGPAAPERPQRAAGAAQRRREAPRRRGPAPGPASRGAAGTNGAARCGPGRHCCQSAGGRAGAELRPLRARPAQRGRTALPARAGPRPHRRHPAGSADEAAAPAAGAGGGGKHHPRTASGGSSEGRPGGAGRGHSAPRPPTPPHGAGTGTPPRLARPASRTDPPPSARPPTGGGRTWTRKGGPGPPLPPLLLPAWRSGGRVPPACTGEGPPGSRIIGAGAGSEEQRARPGLGASPPGRGAPRGRGAGARRPPRAVTGVAPGVARLAPRPPAVPPDMPRRGGPARRGS